MLINIKEQNHKKKSHFQLEVAFFIAIEKDLDQGAIPISFSFSCTA